MGFNFARASLATCVVAVLISNDLALSAADMADAVERIVLLPPGKGNSRNSEGGFVTLNDGRVLFIYTRFIGGRGRDHDPSYLASRYSSDDGRTWSDSDVTVLENEGQQNTMSVSLARLDDGRIAMFYLVKNSLYDCRPYVRFSSDEAKTWSKRTPIVSDERTSYYVLNNDRVIQTKSGRLIVPLARHDNRKGEKYDASATLVCYLSDDGGQTWRESKQSMASDRVVYQEPGVVELSDGRILMFIRTDAGTQYLSWSSDGGETWSVPEPAPQLTSPLSPASIKRIPSTGDLLVVWNNHAGVTADSPNYRKRTPFTAALSKDDGKTWAHFKDIETSPNGWYCYTAITFVGDHVLLGHCAGDTTKSGGLATTQITRFPVSWLDHQD
jgi:Neuraminidase (sialidase)